MYHVIIVDDDELIRKGLERVIQWEKMGFLVSGTFSNGVEALDFIKGQKVNVILTDIKMPQMSGLDLIDEAKKYRPEIKAVIISGYGDFELAKQALLLKVEDYLLKPLGEQDVEKVFLKLRKTLDEENNEAEGRDHKRRPEYELMRILNSRLQRMSLFDNSCGKQEYELVLVRMKGQKGADDTAESMIACEEMVLQVFKECFCCYQAGWLVSLVPPKKLNGFLVHLKRELPKHKEVFCQVLIGKQVYSIEEAVASYWAVVNLAYEEKKTGVIHYERVRSIYKREWDEIQKQKNEMISNLESGQFQKIEIQIQKINELLAHYESRELYYFYCDIVTKLLRYFDMEEQGVSCMFANRHISDVGMQYPEKQQLQKLFRQDMDEICKALWENSDSMKNLLVLKAKTMIENEFADENLSLASVANRLNISYGYLSTIFTKIVGVSFKTYLADVRMQKARTLLLSRNYRIYEIAELVGYRNPRYFTDVFKKYYHLSPVDYIARFRNGQDGELL